MRDVIHTDGAPAAIGPYSQAIRSGEFVFTAGQIGLVPATGRLVEGGVEAEAQQALDNLRAVLEAAGSGLDHAVKVTLFLTDMADFQKVNAVYARAFPAAAPARSAVAVRELPAGARVEIDAIARCA